MARRSKYKFATSKVGDTITVEGVDVYSMTNSLAGYNRRLLETAKENETPALLTYDRIGDADNKGRFTFKRTA